MTIDTILGAGDAGLLDSLAYEDITSDESYYLSYDKLNWDSPRMRISDGKGHVAGGCGGPSGRCDGCLGSHGNLTIVIRPDDTNVVAAIKGEQNVCRSDNQERHDLRSSHTYSLNAHVSPFKNMLCRCGTCCTCHAKSEPGLPM